MLKPGPSRPPADTAPQAAAPDHFLTHFPSIIMLPMFLAVVDQTIVAAALPAIAGRIVSRTGGHTTVFPSCGLVVVVLIWGRWRSSRPFRAAFFATTDFAAAAMLLAWSMPLRRV